MTSRIPFDPLRPYNLPLLPPTFDYKDSKFTELRVKARVELAELKAYSTDMPNQLLLLSPTILKESIASSGVENINTTMMNVLENQLFSEQEQRPQDKEVLRYKDAVIEGFKSLDKYSLATRTIINIHKNLLTDSPGKYRSHAVQIQNNITKEIVYTPPEARRIHELLNNLENFLHQNDDIDPLIKASIIHYQFEAIHPFSDGNGRTGRILMVLYLLRKDLLHFPTLYISGYILKNRNDYYRLLLNVTEKQDWSEYIEFMLNGFYLQAKETKELLFKIKNEYASFKEILKTKYKNIYNAVDLVDTLFAFPVITATKLAENVGCTWETASTYLKTLKKAGLMSDKKMGKYHIYVNNKLIKILHS